jgi:hypothetical protein
MRQSLINVRYVIAFVLCLFFNPSLLIGQQKAAAGCPAGIQQDQLKQELNRAASMALEAIKHGQSENLLPLFSASGVVLGVDGPQVRLGEIRKEITSRTGVYCVIYDTSCLMKGVNASRRKAGESLETNQILSFRDHLLKTAQVVKTDLAEASFSCGGITSDGSPVFELDWAWTPKGWKIVAIPYL